MKIIEAHVFCIYCKLEVTNTQEKYHAECSREVNSFNLKYKVKLGLTINQIELLRLILLRTNLNLEEVLTLKKENLILEKKKIFFSDRNIYLNEFNAIEMTKILEKIPVSEKLFSTSITYPTKFTLSNLLTNSVRLKSLF